MQTEFVFFVLFVFVFSAFVFLFCVFFCFLYFLHLFAVYANLYFVWSRHLNREFYLT